MKNLTHEPGLNPPERPDFTAPCGCDAQIGQAQFRLPDGSYVCEACFRDCVSDLSLFELAEAMDIPVRFLVALDEKYGIYFPTYEEGV